MAMANSEFEFVIPVSREDLLKRTNVNHYVVDEVYSIRTIQFQLKNAEQKFSSTGMETIMKSFDLFYSIVEHFQTLDPDIPLAGWKLILKTFSSLIISLSNLFESERIETKTRQRYLNMVKMTCYALAMFADKFEMELYATTAQNNSNKGSKKKASNKLIDVWEVERELGVKLLVQIFQLKINKLYDPPVVDEELISLVTRICYKILETCHLAKSKQTREFIFKLLGIMVRSHNHCFSCVVKLLQLLQVNEQLVGPLAQAVAVISNDYGAKVIVSEIMREIGSMDPKELSRDTATTRAYSAFILELSKVVPSAVLPSISVVLNLLDEESSTMRNSVLSAMGELIMRLMNKDEEMGKSLKKTRDQLLDHLEEHIVDSNAFVRSKVLQILQNLITEKAVPLSRLCRLLPLINGRVHDRTASVRKNAIQALTCSIKANQFATKFTMEEMMVSLKKELEELQKMEQERQPASSAAAASTAAGGDKEDGGDGNDDTMDEDKDGDTSQSAGMEIDRGEDEDGTESTDPAVIQLEKQRMLVEYLENSLIILKEIHKGITLVGQHLSSKVTSDVIEAIEYFVTGLKLGAQECRGGVRKMLPLVWSKDKDIKESVVMAYKGIYLGNGDKPSDVASSLIKLVISTTNLGDRTALEELIQEFVKCKALDDDVVRILWRKFTFKIPGTSKLESKAALVLLQFVASENTEMVEMNLDTLVEEGLENPDEDYLIVAETCRVLSKLMGKRRLLDDQPPRKLETDHRIFQVLSELLVSGMSKFDHPNYAPMVEQAVATIYKLAERPDVICQEIIYRQVAIISVGAGGGQANNHDNTLTEEQQEDLQQQPNNVSAHSSSCPLDDIVGDANLLTQTTAEPKSLSSTQSDATVCPSEMLARLLMTCGCVALQQLILVDVVIFAEMKRRQRLAERPTETPRPGRRKSVGRNRRERTISEDSNSRSDAESVISRGASSTLNAKQKEDEEGLGLGGHSAEDADAEYIRKVTERELVTGGENLLSMVMPIIISVCSNQLKFSDSCLYSASVLAMIKYMIVSSECCESHLRFVFTVLERCSDPLVRSNIIVCLGDLASRYPNLLEPWTGSIYSRLKDKSVDVRLNTVHVLTRLILNDMIKVKGQISDVARHIRDPDQSIASAVKSFFSELSMKPNAIYNILPDIVSHLSNPESETEEEQFQDIMKYLMAFIEKEKQAESLCEKLAHRMRATVTERQWRDLAFCLSLLPANEKCIKKLNENFTCFSDKLHDSFVLECFVTLISNAKKCFKPEAKTVIDEFEDRVVNYTKRRQERDAAGEADDISDELDPLVSSFVAPAGKKPRQSTAKKPNKVSKKVKGKKRLKVTHEDEEDEEDDDFSDDDDDEDGPTAHAADKKKAATSKDHGSRTVKKKPPPASKAAPTTSRRTKRALQFSSSEDELEFD